VEALCHAAEQNATRWLIDQQDAIGRTALHVTASRGLINAVNVLLQRGASIIVQDDDDNAAVHAALLAVTDSTSTTQIVRALCASQQAAADKSFIRQPGAQRYVLTLSCIQYTALFPVHHLICFIDLLLFSFTHLWCSELGELHPVKSLHVSE
jgi:ankyrin repeat protein